MSRISVLSRPKREWLMALFVVASVLLLAGCGGGGGDSSQAQLPAPGGSTPTQPTTPVVTGVATPTSVAVVTATNAQ